MPATQDNSSWYVIHTHPKQESRAENNLNAWGVETFCPRLKERRTNPYTNAPTYVVKHLFPRYIFARFDASSLLHQICFTRGVSSVVCFGDGPAAIGKEVIDLIRSQIAQDGFIRAGEPLRSGDKVEVRDGPLGSFVGIFEREMNDSERVMILLATVNYQCRFVVEKELVKKLGQQSNSMRA